MQVEATITIAYGFLSCRAKTDEKRSGSATDTNAITKVAKTGRTTRARPPRHGPHWQERRKVRGVMASTSAPAI